MGRGPPGSRRSRDTPRREWRRGAHTPRHRRTAHEASGHVWWPRLIIGTSVVALGLAIAGMAKAQSGSGGSGFQVLMIIASALVLCVAVLVARKF